MADKLEHKKLVTFGELLVSNTIEQEPLVNLLEKKGLLVKDELMEDIKRLKATTLQVKK